MKTQRLHPFWIYILWALLIPCIALSQSNQKAPGPSLPAIADYSVQQKGDKVIISWTANKDEAGVYYIIEKSTNNKSFKPAGIILGPKPGAEKPYFIFQLKRQEKKKCYYRLSQVKSDELVQVVAIASL